MHNDGRTIHSAQHHLGWDRSIPPAMTIEPGSTILLECLDSGAGQIDSQSTVASVSGLDFSRVNPITGPIFVEGSEPGDALKVTIGDFEPSGFGWTAIIPGFGLLSDQFPDPALTLWTYDKFSMAPALFSTYGKVPLKPFAGTIGVAPAEAGRHSVVPPRRVGGNLDIRDLTTGSILYLPIEVAGGLWAIRTPHRETVKSAAQQSRAR